MNIDKVDLHLQPKHMKKLQKGDNFQLTHTQLHHALSTEPNVSLHMMKKHISEMKRNHRSGKGYRFKHEKIHGGKLNLRDIGRKLKNTFNKVKGGVQKAMKDPTINRAVKDLGHVALASATQKLADNGYNSTAYSNLAHQAIEGHNVKDQLKQQLANDVVDYAHEKALGGVGVKKRGKKGGSTFAQRQARRARNFGNSVAHTIGAIASNPVVQHVATQALVEGAMAGAGKRHHKHKGKRFTKGSAEAKAHMAHLRSLRRKGGALFPA